MPLSARSSFIGELLIDEGIITRQQLDEALEKQKLTNNSAAKGLLGQTLVELGYCNSDDVSKAIASKAGVQYLTMDDQDVSASLSSLITPELAVKYNVLPIGFENGRLLLAMKNPGDIIAIDDLRLITGYSIKPVVINDKELDIAIKRFSNMNMAFQEMEEEDEIQELKEEEQQQKDNLDQRPAVQLANQIVNQAVKSGASDIHIEPQEKRIRVRYRIDGVLHEIMQQPIKLHPTLVSRIKVISNMDIAERRIPQDGRITLKVEGNVIDVRVASMPSAYGEKLTMRLLNRNDRVITLKQLGFNEKELVKYEKTLNSPYGFILITGPTGSGKSTTLYASLAQLNQPDKNIITLEDPIERRMEGLTQVQVNIRAGMTFASGLRSILRNDPDIIMVGEIRDHETARISVESALTGHLVLSTMHTNDSAGAITRLGDMGIEPYLSASSLIGVIAQRLMRVLCKECKQPDTVSREQVLNSAPDFPFDKEQKELTLYKAKGCVHCNGTGYKGRIGIYEFLNVTEDIQKLILERASVKEIHNASVENGMITMRQDGLLKAKKGITTIEEVLRVVV